jgi:hypothetical protein
MKAGDKVKIKKGESYGCNGWVPDMDEYIGKEAMIVMVHDGEVDHANRWVDLDIDESRFGWNCNWLEVL